MCLGVFIWRCATTSCREIAVLFGIAESSVVRCTLRVMFALWVLRRRYICWPLSSSEVAAATSSMYARAGMPRCLGAVDGHTYPLIVSTSRQTRWKRTGTERCIALSCCKLLSMPGAALLMYTLGVLGLTMTQMCTNAPVWRSPILRVRAHAHVLMIYGCGWMRVCT